MWTILEMATEYLAYSAIYSVFAPTTRYNGWQACCIRKVISMVVNVVAQLGDLPAAQHGYFTRAQATVAGIPDFDLTRSVQRRFIDRVGHGVYRVAGAGDDPLAALRVAWFRLDPAKSPRQRLTRPTIWVAHESAAKVHGFGVFVESQHTFISTHRLQPGVGTTVLRRSRGLDRSDWEVRDGFAVTTVSRTASDLLAAHADGGHVGRFLGDALRAGTIMIDDLGKNMALSRNSIAALVAQGEPRFWEPTDG